MGEEAVEDIEVEEEPAIRPPPEEVIYHLASLLIMFICVLNLLVCLFTVFVIKVFKKAQLQFYTRYVFHCSAIMTGILMLLLIANLLHHITPTDYTTMIEVYCVLSDAAISLLSGQHILYTAMSIDFVLAAYYTTKSQKFIGFFNKFVIAHYVYLIFCGVFVNPILCIYRLNPFIPISVSMLTFGFYFLTIIVVGVICCYKRITHSTLTDATSLKIALAHLVWLLVFIGIFTHSFCFSLFSNCVALCSPLVVLILCCCCDINFRTCTVAAFRCNCKYENVEGVEGDTVLYDHQSSQVLQIS